jgi:ABC-type amino acid transport substrate-binding protein
MRYVWYSIIGAFCLLVSPLVASAAVLAPAQEEWLAKHKDTIIVRPEKNYPPFSFVSSGPSLKPKGLAVDYLELVARKVSARATYLDASSRSVLLAEIKAGKEGVILALSPDGEYADSLYFSEPFVSLPAVIVVRKDYRRSKDLSLGDFSAKQVAITDGYGAMEYVKNNYQRIIIDPVSDDEVALQKVLLGEVDAAVMDVASLSYYTSRDMLSYVTVAGQTGFEYTLSFAVPKTMPDMQVILNAGLKEITPAEHAVIKDRWVTVSGESTKPSFSLALLGTPLWAGLSVVGAIIIAVLLTIIIMHNKRYHHLRNISSEKKKKQQVEALTSKLEELENLEEQVKESIEEIQQ